MKNNKDILNDIYKELTKLVYSFTKKYKIIFFYFLICVALIKILECIPLKIIPGSTDAWLSFWSTIFGSFISIVFTIFVMLYTIKNDENKRIAEKLPIIVPSNTKYSDLQIIKNGLPTNELKYFTQKLYIDVHNLGLTGIFDIKGTVQVLDNINNKILDVITNNDKIIINNKYFNPSNIVEEYYFEFNRNLNLPSQQQSILHSREMIKIELPHEISLYLFALERAILANNDINIEFSPNIKINLEFKSYKNICDNIEFIVNFSEISINSSHNYGNFYSYYINGIATVNISNH